MQMVVSGEISSLTNVDVFCKNILVWEPVLQQVLLHCPTALGARNLKCTILGLESPGFDSHPLLGVVGYSAAT